MPKPESAGAHAVGALAFVIAFVVVRYAVSELRYERATQHAVSALQDGSILDPLRDGSVDPHAFTRAAAASGGAYFRRTWAAGVALNIRRGLPGAELAIDSEARADDLGSVFRGVVTFRGRAPLDDGPALPVRGEVRTYYHEAGAFTIEVFCIEEYEPCGAAYTRLVAEAEKLVLAMAADGSLNHVDFEWTLPPSDECGLDEIHDPYRDVTNLAWICIYDPEIILSFIRMDRAGTVTTLEANLGDPELLRTIRGALRN